jgi:hypothetical protein
MYTRIYAIINHTDCLCACFLQDMVFRKTAILEYLLANFKADAGHMKRIVNAVDDVLYLMPKNHKETLLVEQQVSKGCYSVV